MYVISSGLRFRAINLHDVFVTIDFFLNALYGKLKAWQLLCSLHYIFFHYDYVVKMQLSSHSAFLSFHEKKNLTGWICKYQKTSNSIFHILQIQIHYIFYRYRYRYHRYLCFEQVYFSYSFKQFSAMKLPCQEKWHLYLS